MKSCFFICPLGEEKSEVRERANTLMKHVLIPVTNKLGYSLKRADLAFDAKVSESISKAIFESDIVIADLSDNNANVYYELGKRHAWKGACIHLRNNLSKIPFDLRDYRIYEYNLNNLDKVSNLKVVISEAIKTIEKTPVQTPYPLKPTDVVNLSGCTVLIDRKIGPKEHYYLAETLAEKNTKRIFLMQRSSSLILGPEQGWGAEETFYQALLKMIEKGTEFYHIVSLEGIKRHLDRKHSVFPQIEKALSNLVKKGTKGCVAIRSPKKGGRLMYFRRIPEIEENIDIKPDRQARVFIIEDYDNNFEGVIVIDLGGTQSAFYLKGPEIGTYLDECIKFYNTCDYLKWNDVISIVKNHIQGQ